MYTEEEIAEKMSEFKNECYALKEKYEKSEKEYHEAFKRHSDLSSESVRLSFKIDGLSFFRMKEKQELRAEKEKLDIEKEKADKLRIETFNRFKKTEQELEDFKKRFYAFCKETGYPVPNDTPSKEEEE